MAIPVFPPSREGELAAWAANFDTKINANTESYGLTLAQAVAFTSLSDAFIAAYNTVVNPNTNAKQAVIAKNQAKEALLHGTGGAWELVRIVQAFPGTTNAMRGELGLRIPDTERTPVAAPAVAPDLSIVSMSNRLISVRLRDQENPESRGKPPGVDGATVLYYVGETAPLDPTVWIFAMNVSRTTFDVEIPSSIPANSTIWLTAFWFNARKESSPAASPESTVIAGGMSQAA